MPPNFHFSSSRTQIPFSLIPSLPIAEQIRIVHSVLRKFEDFNRSNQKKFLRIISEVKENNFTKVLNTFKPIGRNLWKYHTFSFIYDPKMVVYDLFTKRKGLTLLKVIRNTLQLKTISWVCLIQQETVFMFTLSCNGFLLWSLIPNGIAPYFIASILSDESILDSIDDLWRWNFLEKNKSQLLDFINKETLMKKEPFISQFFSLIDNFLMVKEKLILEIDDTFSSLPFCNNCEAAEINNQIHQFLNLQEKSVNVNNIIEPLRASKWRDGSDIPFKSYYWLLDLSPILFLEIIPQIKNLDEKQKLGVYYTPIALVETIIPRAFNVFIDQDLTRPLTSLKVFDPAMGTGILLVFAIEWLVNLMIKFSTSDDNSFIDLRRLFAYSNIKGIDIDKDSILIYKEFLKTFYVLEKNKEQKFGLEATDFIESFLRSSEFNQSFPKFDVILSNPPYLAFHSRFTKKFPLKVELDTLRQLIPVFSGKRDNTYLIFLGICLQQFLAPKGVVGFVIDHSFLDLPSYKKIRKHLLSKYHVSYILANYNYRKTAVVDLSLLVIRNIRNSQPTLWQETLEEDTQEISSEYFLAQSNCSFRYQERNPLLSHLNAITIPLGNITSLSCGLEYGALLKTNFLSSKAKKGFYKCIDGSNGLSHPYFLFWVPGQQNSYVRFDKEYEQKIQDTNQNISRTNKKVILISGNLNRFLTEKIILRQTAAEFIGTIDKQKYLSLRNTHLIYHPKQPYSLYLILGILCSTLGNHLGERYNIIRKPRKESSRYPQIRLNDLKKFPIIDVEKISDNTIIDQVEKAVKECLDVGQSISTAMTSLWGIFQEEGTKFISQRQFLRTCINKDLLKLLPTKKHIVTVQQWDIFISDQFFKLSAKRKEIDSLVFKLYNIDQQDQRKLLSSQNSINTSPSSF